MAKTKDPKKETKPRMPKTPAEKAAMKEKTAQRRQEFEAAVTNIKNNFGKVWAGFEGLRTALANVPADEQQEVAQTLGRVMRNISKPDKKTKAEERIKARIAKLNEQREKAMKDLEELDNVI